VSDLFERACALIREAASHPDPEGALAALEAEAGADDRPMFPMLWEGLVLALNDAPGMPDGDR
jgi:hypothetical protein